MRNRSEKNIYVLHFDIGSKIASELCEGLGAEDVLISEGGTADAFSSRWVCAGAFVFIGALAIAVRSTADLIEDKASDPALVVVSEDGGVSLPVIAGHIGLATDLARECAEILSSRGTMYIPTTSSDRAGLIAPDLWASRRGYGVLLRSRLTSAIAKFKNDGGISVWVDPIMLEYGINLPLPFGYGLVDKQADADIIISPRSVQKLVGAKAQIVPKVITVGVGCRAGIRADVVERILKSALSRNRYGPFLSEAISELRTVEAKRDEEGLVLFAAKYSLPIVIVPDEEILSMGGDFTPSAASRHIGLPGAAEPAAASAGILLGSRVAESGVTIAISISKPMEAGKLAIVGIGPGDARFVTMEAKAAIDASEVIVGYGLYVDLLPEPWKRGKIVERYGMGEEETRVSRAMSYVTSGYRVAVVSGGDASLFGMASLCLSMLPDILSPESVRVIPGITAAQAAGAIAGAPYSNGLALVSLSDYLQPWRDVRRSLEGARESGMAVAVYNPVSRGLSEKLGELRGIFAGRRALLVRDAGRPGESMREIQIEELSDDSVDMRTVIFILSPRAREKYLGPRKLWIEARGYESEITDVEIPRGGLGQFLVLGGTTEGREAASYLMKNGYSVRVSVTREAGASVVPRGAEVLLGERDSPAWVRLLGDSACAAGLLGVVDATHPFASGASREIASACSETGVPLCRFVRKAEIPEEAITVPNMERAVLKAIEVTSGDDLVFLAIGTNDLGFVVPRLRETGRGVLVRMLPTVESMRQAERVRLSPREILAMWGAGNADFNEALCRDKNARCIVSRESGPQGGVDDKAEAARRLRIPLVLVIRPEEPDGVTRVKDIDELLGWCEERKTCGRDGVI
ncbi:MAG: precorrin-6A reductase [Synergistaceae bacterium]|jgi:cobalt-precorrin 5A hydrolase/precorrin-3B C17-methyltransferase|nr:precorrin-6A reductase [Synergistaceae bacterium]